MVESVWGWTVAKKDVLKGLQIFRGFAATFVLLAHAQMYVHSGSLLKVFGPGTSGVTFFFVLSGFIICYGNYSKVGSGAGTIAFIIKRLKRIYPIYWVYTAAILGVSFLFYLKTNSLLVNSNSYRASDFLKSFLLLPYSKIGDQWPFIPVAWTLSYEMLFYLAFSVAIFIRSRYSLVSVMAALLVLSFISSDIINFLFGCAIAVAVKRKVAIPGKTFVIAGCALLAVSWGLIYTGTSGFARYPGPLTFGIPYGLLIWGAASLESSSHLSLTETKVGRALAYVGDASYSIYLTHYWALALLSIMLSPLLGKGAALFATISTTAVIIGLAGYRYIEKPLLHRSILSKIKIVDPRASLSP